MRDISLTKLAEIAGNQALRLEEELYSLANTYSEHYDFRWFFENPIISRGGKLKALQEIFPGYSPLFFNLLALLLDEGLEKKILELSREYTDLIAKQQSLIFVNVKSRYSLNETEKQRIRELLNQNIYLREELDSSLIGGFKFIASDGKYFDVSLQGRLEKLKEEMCYV